MDRSEEIYEKTQYDEKIAYQKGYIQGYKDAIEEVKRMMDRA